MSAIAEITTKLTDTEIATAEALEIFDQLEPVDLAFMMSRWQGSEVQTNHPLNGLLEVSNWYGKEFISPDHVHPLLIKNGDRPLLKVKPNPTLLQWGPNLPILKNPRLQPLFTVIAKVIQTEASQARVRMMAHRHKVSATMIYDHLPIHDIFRKIDQDTVLGLMDYKAWQTPFFFLLRRDQP